MAIAILDFGTNTFNLLIAEKRESSFHILYEGKEPVKLGKGGIEKKIITPEAFQRGLTAIEHHLERIRHFQAREIHAFATSAIRTAKNGKDFVQQVYDQFGISVRIIPGEREAELIYKGVKQAVPLTGENSLILDIGGGSNEFIICNAHELIWKYSFEIGMARILEKFPLSDPVTGHEINRLEAFFKNSLQQLFDMVRKEHPATLIGASGTFDTFYSLIRHRKKSEEDHMHGREINLTDYFDIHRSLLNSTLEERLRMKGMEPVRVEMIVAATIFVNFVIRECRIGQLFQSDFALKEGVAAELTGLDA